MLSDEVIEKVTERLVNRIEQANTYVLKEIGKSINKIGTLTPTKAQELAQILKYGGDYNKITKQLAKITNLNVSDIQKIFEEVAKRDYQFAKQFYDYRGISYIPYENNLTLKNQVDAISRLMVGNYINKTSAIGFSVKDLDGNVIFKNLETVYRDTIDKAVLSISQGKSTFDNEMYKTIKELASSGLKTLDYESGRSIRLDSAISMNMKDTLRQMHNETQEVIGEQFGYDGVEITVHENPAEDHEDAQGKQFSLEQYELLQTTGYATTYDNKKIDMHLELKSGESSISFRPISQYNCYHYTFAIILGVSVPAYSNEELEQIQERNNKGFDFDGKHYTMYEGTQLQRKLERKIREQKDIQIMAKESGQMDLVDSSQRNITALTRKYKELSKASGLPTKMDRMRVSEYKRINIKKSYLIN